MDPLTLGGTVIGILAAVAGIVAAVVQVREYLEKRRKKPDGLGLEVRPLTPAPAQVPHNLPPRREFVGREKEKARVHEALRSRSYLVSIDGIGGIGKTVLALEVAHECLRASRGDGPTDGIATFDGFIWTTAKDRDLTLNALLDAVARTLDYPGIAQQPLEEKRTAVQRLLQEKPHLLIVDNFETIADENVRDFLLELPEPSKALITTREQKLRRVWAISLKGLAENEALTLIRSTGKRLGLRALEQGEDQILRHLYEATGGTPLAIKWAVGQIKQKGQSMDTVLAALHEARGNLFDNIFARSWNLLTEDARQVLIVMPLFATSASRAGLEAASDMHHFALDEALGQLVEMSLVDATDELDVARRRYSIHPLMRAFATAKLQWEPEIGQTARRRLAEFFHAFTRKYGGFWVAGFTLLEPDVPNVLAIIQWCWDHQKLVNVAMDIFHDVAYFMISRGYWNDTMDFGQRAVTMAADLGDELNAARFKVWPVSWIYRHRGDLDQAERHITEALEVLYRLDEKEGIAAAKHSLGRLAQERGQLEQAERLLEEAFAYYESVEDELQIYFLTANLANLALEQGNLEKAWELSMGVEKAARQFGDPEIVASLLNTMGGVARQRGDLQQAKAFLEEALTLRKQVNRLDEIADTLLSLARVQIEMNMKQTARQMLSDALETYQKLEMLKARTQEVGSLLAQLSESTDQTEQERY